MRVLKPFCLVPLICVAVGCHESKLEPIQMGNYPELAINIGQFRPPVTRVTTNVKDVPIFYSGSKWYMGFVDPWGVLARKVCYYPVHFFNALFPRPRFRLDERDDRALRQYLIDQLREGGYFREVRDLEKQEPADDAVTLVVDITHHKLWQKGPRFLIGSSRHWSLYATMRLHDDNGNVVHQASPRRYPPIQNQGIHFSATVWTTRWAWRAKALGRQAVLQSFCAEFKSLYEKIAKERAALPSVSLINKRLTNEPLTGRTVYQVQVTRQGKTLVIPNIWVEDKPAIIDSKSLALLQVTQDHTDSKEPHKYDQLGIYFLDQQLFDQVALPFDLHRLSGLKVSPRGRHIVYFEHDKMGHIRHVIRRFPNLSVVENGKWNSIAAGDTRRGFARWIDVGELKIVIDGTPDGGQVEYRVKVVEGR